MVKKWGRHGAQTLWALITNSHFQGFASGTIAQGKTKNLCVPGMNCYSCPGAQGACPIGALQAIIGHYNYDIAFYVGGFLLLIGALLGRFVCGWLCPFGLIQDLLHKIPFPKKWRTISGDAILRKTKYVIFIVFVVLMPLFLVDVIGQGAPYFCKLLCPVGTLEGGIPLVLKNPSLQATIGTLYIWKNALLAITLVASVLIYRPFCKYICPLGAVYSVFNPISVYRYHLDESKCIHCQKCARMCKMNVNPVHNCNAAECIRCGDCKHACSTKAITSGWK